MSTDAGTPDISYWVSGRKATEAAPSRPLLPLIMRCAVCCRWNRNQASHSVAAGYSFFGVWNVRWTCFPLALFEPDVCVLLFLLCRPDD